MANTIVDTQNSILEHIVGKTTYTLPATVYLALATSAPGPTTTGATLAEPPTANGYARVNMNGKWSAAAAASIANVEVSFGQASNTWGTVTHWALVSSATAGQGAILNYGTLTASRAVATSDVVKVSAGALTIPLTKV